MTEIQNPLWTHNSQDSLKEELTTIMSKVEVYLKQSGEEIALVRWIKNEEHMNGIKLKEKFDCCWSSSTCRSFIVMTASAMLEKVLGKNMTRILDDMEQLDAKDSTADKRKSAMVTTPSKDHTRVMRDLKETINQAESFTIDRKNPAVNTQPSKDHIAVNRPVVDLSKDADSNVPDESEPMEMECTDIQDTDSDIGEADYDMLSMNLVENDHAYAKLHCKPELFTVTQTVGNSVNEIDTCKKGSLGEAIVKSLYQPIRTPLVSATGSSTSSRSNVKPNNITPNRPNLGVTKHISGHEQNELNKTEKRCMKKSQHVEGPSEFQSHKNPPTCRVCDKCYKTRRELWEHMALHYKPYECTVCKCRFHTESRLRNHKRNHTDGKPFYCEKCGHRFRSEHHFNAHKCKICKKPRFSCEICNSKLSTQALKYKHMKNRHSKEGEEPHSCKYCCEKNKLITSQEHSDADNIANKSKSSSGVDDNAMHSDDLSGVYVVTTRRVICKNGGSVVTLKSQASGVDVTSPSSVNAIPNSQEADEDLINPPGCISRKKTDAILNRLRLKRFRCKLCNSNFVHIPDLVKHVQQTHSTEKPKSKNPAVCSDCGTMFLRYRGYKYHLRLYSGKGLFECKICGKGFFPKSELNKHKKVHSKQFCQKPVSTLATIDTCNDSVSTDELNIATSIDIHSESQGTAELDIDTTNNTTSEHGTVTDNSYSRFQDNQTKVLINQMMLEEPSYFEINE